MDLFQEELRKELIWKLINSKFETIALDFKEQFDTNNVSKSYLELIKDIVAFANTEGGYIIYGVTDSFELRGVPTDLKIDSANIDNHLQKYTDLNIRYVLSEQEFDDMKFIVIFVQQSKPVRPVVFKIDGQYNKSNGKTSDVFKKGQVYVRNGSKSEPNLSFWFEFHKAADKKIFIPNYKLKHNLPKPNYGEAFVGREKDLKIILDGILEEEHTYRILIHGIGGLGKTALAQKAAYLLLVYLLT